MCLRVRMVRAGLHLNDSSFTLILDPVYNRRYSSMNAVNKIARTFNDVYRSYNSSQYPFLLVDFRLPPGTSPTHNPDSIGSYDINLTPDKRTILLHEEQPLVKELIVPPRPA
jgi:DNA mismatch repair ATPase MutL